jgi:hypothetical protein
MPTAGDTFEIPADYALENSQVQALRTAPISAIPACLMRARWVDACPDHIRVVLWQVMSFADSRFRRRAAASPRHCLAR